jgi:hypothetical protein
MSNNFQQWLARQLTRLSNRKNSSGINPYYPIPKDLDDIAGWDHFWNVRIPEQDDLFQFYDFTQSLIPALQERGCQTVLFAGNGISLEPRAFAAAGFRVTALDVSVRATDYAARFALEPAHLQRFAYFSAQRPTSDLCQNAVVSYVVGSIFDEAISQDPFDVIISRRTLQLFPNERMLEGMRLLFRRLAKKGVLINHTHNNYPSGWFLRDELLSRNIPASTDYDVETLLRSYPNHRVVWLPGSSG